jgi:hypothetical protein
LACKPGFVVKKNVSRKETNKTKPSADLTKCLLAMRPPFEKGLTHQESTPVKDSSPQLNFLRPGKIGSEFHRANS